MSIKVYTCISGGKDDLIEQKVKGDFVAFSDVPLWSDTWKIEKLPEVFKSDRRNSRIPKMLAHMLDCDYSIYIDGNIELLVEPQILIEKYLQNHDIALFKHPARDCIYDEAVACAKMRIDDPELIITQMKRYEDEGFAKHKGLCENGVILRRHTKKIEEFNNAWFSEYVRGSVRDQLCFMYAADKVGLRINVIDEPYQPDGIRGFIKMYNHLTARPEPKR